jgi:NADP-dependent 3-hydroxy acid dehydrogenase YdfG
MLITGASSGIGEGWPRSLRGGVTACHCGAPPDRLEHWRRVARGRCHAQVVTIALDVADTDAIEPPCSELRRSSASLM